MLLAAANEQLSHSLREAQASEKRHHVRRQALSLNALSDARMFNPPTARSHAGRTVGRLSTEVDICPVRRRMLEEFRRDGRADKFPEYCARDGHTGWAVLPCNWSISTGRSSSSPWSRKSPPQACRG
jgi:hypothetical protein